MITVSVTGDQAIDAVVRDLPAQMNHQVLGAAHMLSAKPLVEKEKLLAPEGPTGNLVDSIGATRTSISKANSIGEVRVGPRRKGVFKGFAGHLVEFGTKRRSTKNGANRGVMRAKPFVKPAFALTKGQIERSIAENIAKVLLRTMKRHLK
jgi:HK97 gp10 family phage protein